MSRNEQSSDSQDVCGNAPRVNVQFAIWFAILFIVATALRAYRLGSKSFWLDEAASSMLARTDWHTFLSALVHRQANMTLYYFLLRGWMHFGNTETFVRALSVLFGVAAIPIMYQLANMIFGHKTARVAALLLSVHQFHVEYSQEARGYSLGVLLALLSSYLFVRLSVSATRAIWAAYILTSVLLVYAHVFGAWILLAQWLCALVLPGRPTIRTGLPKAAGVIAMLVSPLALSLLFLSSRSQLSWMNQNPGSSLYQVLLAFGGNAGISLLILELGPILGSLFFHLRNRSSGGNRSSYTSLWIWLLLPIVTVGVASFRWPVLQSRYLIVCLPPFLLIVADGLVRIRSRVVFVAALMAVVGLSLFGVSSYLQRRVDLSHIDDWRDATHHVLSEAQSGDAVLFPYSAEEIAFREYQDRFAKAGAQIPLLPHNTDLELLSTAGTWASPELASDAASKYARVWVITALQPTDASRRAQAELSRKLKKTAQQNFGFITTQLFEHGNTESH